jgi:signal transduction histidine kinase
LERANGLLLALSRVAGRVAAADSPRAVFQTLGAELLGLGLNSVVALREGDAPGFIIEHASIDSKALAAVKALTGLSVIGYRIHPERWPAEVSSALLAGEAVYVAGAYEIAVGEVPILPRSVVEAALRVVGWAAHIPSVSTPLLDEGRVIGLLAIWGADVREEDVPVFSVFAGQIATAIANARLHEALRRQMQELSQAELQLLQSFRLAAIGELAAFVAHEVNNPLTSVLGNLWLVMRDLPAGAPERMSLETAQREATRIARVVRTLLDHTEELEPSIEPVLVNEVLDSALLLLRQQLERVEFQADLTPALPPVMADRNDLRHAFLNLISNALDATPVGGRVEVATCRRQMAGHEFVEVVVSDSGRGIAPGDQIRIFDPFFTTKPVRGRPGLGLAVSKRLVEQHRGTIEVQSTPGRGSRFIVRFPRGEEPDPTATPQAPAAAEA